MYTIMSSSDNNYQIEVINEIQRRRRRTVAEKLALVQLTFESGNQFPWSPLVPMIPLCLSHRCRKP